MDKNKISNEINYFLNKISKEFSPCKILLFGSRAKNNEAIHSDYDIIIISDKFEGIHWLDRISAVLKNWDFSYDLDVLPYTSSEFKIKLKESSFIKSILKDSIELIPS